MNENEIMVVEAEYLHLGSVKTANPTDLVKKATHVATALADIIKTQELATRIQGRDFVRVEGWATLGAMLGVLPREVGVKRYEDGTYEAIVELIRTSDGSVIGRGSAICGMDETWGKRKEYARRSMAITRATGKAYRLAFSWIMTLAGYEPTPAEEMSERRPPQRKQTMKKPPAQNGKPKTMKQVWARWNEVFSEAQAIGLEVKSIAADATREEIYARGKELAVQIEQAKHPAIWSLDVIKAIIDAKLTKNSHSATATLKHAKLTPVDPVDVFVGWFKVYRESKDAGGTTEDAAAVANAWLPTK